MTTLQAIAKELKITHQAVSCIEKRILHKIKQALQKEGFSIIDLDNQTNEMLAHQYFMQQWIRDYENQNLDDEVDVLCR